MADSREGAEDAHTSALSLLAESSASRSTTPKIKTEETMAQTEETYSDAEMEMVRLKMMKARARMGTLLDDIPTGREYDSPPCASDETVKKEYNAASLVRPLTESAHYIDKLGADGSNKLAGLEVRENVSMIKKENEVKIAPQVGTLKSMCLSTMKQTSDSNEQKMAKDDHSKSSVIVNHGDFAASSSAQNAASSITMSVGSGSEDKQSTGGSAKQVMASLSAESAVTATPPRSPASALDRTSSSKGFVPTSEAKQEPSVAAMKSENMEEAKSERADHLSLNEFLMLELEVYCSRLLGRECPNNGSSDVSDLARITSQQLYQDHQRALMDFDDEWKRSHAVKHRGYSPVISEELTATPKNVRTNPFQHDAANTISVGNWTALVNQVRASGTKPALEGTSYSPEVNVQESTEQLLAAYKQGSNGIIVGGDNFHEERLQVSAFMVQIASSQSTSAFHVVVAASSDLAQWEKALSSERLIQLYPYWGSKQDRQNLLQLLSNEYFSSRNLSAHVLLTSYEVFMEDISVVTSLQCQLSIIDIPRQATDQIAAIWPQLLSLRCRQRLLLCQPGFEVDARKLLHFLVPELFSSRRKLLAWNSAALHTDQVCALCRVVKAFTVISNKDAFTAFMSKVESCTMRNCESEMAALEMLNKQGIVRAIQPSIMMPVKRVLSKKARNRVSGHIPAKGKIKSQKATFNAVDPQLTIRAPNVHPKKRSGNDGTASRQRIGRCGKCAGCLAEDCMKCGHCQDMKKYGGPGLRKQSCKTRKCLNPKMWGLASRKRKRKTKRAGNMNNAKVLELDDEGSVAYSSVESDGESVSTATYGKDGSDNESLRYSDATIDSPRDLLLPASDTLLDDHISLSDLSSRSTSARSRVVRCGECQGCHAPDCMICPHCLDMKKYGGPGLRKQTCKNRKCNAPKTVVLNQAKGDHDQYVDEMGNVVYSGLSDNTFPGFYEASDSSDRPESAAVSPHSKSQVGKLSVIQECERYLKPRLVFACMDCVARFSSSKVLGFHSKVEHSSLTGQHALVPTALEREASRLFTSPIYQNAMISAQLKQRDQTSHGAPLGYAKLEGQNFQYYFIEAFVVLGRMDAQWCKLYESLGFRTLMGLTGGTVDCHVGNDSMIAARHAVISWNAHLGSFTIECMSPRTPISVNGCEVSFSSAPVALSSRSLVQVGASVFYFLLPKATKTRSAVEASSSQRS